MAPIAVLAIALGVSAGGVVSRHARQIHEDSFGVAGHQLLVGPYVPLQLGAIDGVDTGHSPAQGPVIGGRDRCKVKAKQLFHVIMDTRCSVLVQDS